MPTYEYLCKTCSHRFEQWQKMSDEPLTICPECGGSIRRVLYPAGVVFKGSGFYKTDHSSSGPAAESNGHAKHDGNGKTPESSANGKSATGESKSGSSETSSVSSTTSEKKETAPTK